MSVSLYYNASRPTPLTDAESAEIARIVATHEESFPYEDEEPLYLYTNPDDLLAGSTKLPLDPDHMAPVITHVLAAVTALHRALPTADWHVHLDDLDIPWHENQGYTLPGLDDPDLLKGL